MFLSLVSLVGTFALSSLPVPQRAQALGAAQVRAPARTVFVGRVVTVDGRPARGACVETSAGGETVSRADGSFELAVDVPLDASSLEITAILARAGGALVASASLVPSASTTSIGTLVLQPSGRPPRWLPSAGQRPGTDGTVRAFASFDDGSGPGLYAAGSFTQAGGTVADHVARWDGERWTALPGIEGMSVYALAVFDDGTGPALYAGGSSPSNTLHHIARWDGEHWSPLGSGVSGPSGYGPEVSALAVFDDGSGPALYVGGSLTSAGGVAVQGIARWNGVSWSAVGGGLIGFAESVESLAVFDDGSGPVLYAGGTIYTSQSGIGVERWDGSSWSLLGSGIDGIDASAMAVFDDGSGSGLYVGGNFSTAGGALASSIARWDGTSWSTLGSGVSGGFPFGYGYALALAVYDDGSGAALYVGGGFTNAGGLSAPGFARWDGSSWSVPAGLPVVLDVNALFPFDDGHGERLFVAGGSGGLPANGIARWDGTNWSEVGSGPSDALDALATFDDGGGTALYAGGAFTRAGGTQVNGIARWDGESWSPLASGTDGSVHALAACDLGGGPALFAGGEFHSVGGVSSNNVARWNGSSWSTLRGGVVGAVRALASFDDGTGTMLYVGGAFSRTGQAGLVAPRIARWNGTDWFALAPTGPNGEVDALAVFDDGSGPALYAGGAFTMLGGVAASHVGRWDGASWSALGAGTNGTVQALTVFDDGDGPALYAAGSFTSAGGGAASRIARWDGASWTPLGGGTSDTVFALATFDDGFGPALFVGGSFTSASGRAARSVARWKHSSWSVLGPGLASGPVRALAVFDAGDGASLHLGGAFPTSPSGDSFLARWGDGQRGLLSDRGQPR